MSDKLNKNILATIVYYSGLNYPLTSFEVWKNLIRTDYYGNNPSAQITLAEIVKQLSDDNLKKYIENQNGFYFIKGESYLVEKRIKNNKISVGKINKLIKKNASKTV